MINSPRFGDDNGDVSIPDKDGENEKSGDDESGEKEKLGDDEGGEKDPTGEKPESPEAELPEANVINLDFSTVEIDDVQFNLPTELAVEVVTAYRSASSLTAKDWLVLAKRGRVTRGIHLDRALAGRSADDAVADEAAFDWHYDRDRNFLGLQPTSKVETSIVYTSTVSNLVHNRIASASLTFDSPFVAGAATANRNEMQAKSQVRKRLFMTGAWQIRYAELELWRCLRLSNRFIDAVDEALKAPDDSQFDALRAVFDRFGHAIPRRVSIGGQLYFQSERITSGDVAASEVKETLSAAVNAKYAGVQAGASAGFSDGTGSKVSAQNVADNTSFTCVGGDIALGPSPNAWTDSTKDPNSWAVISRDDLIPITNYLSADRRERIERIWLKGLQRVWGTAPPKGYVLPDLDGKPFTITACDSSHSSIVCPPFAGYLATTGPENLLSNPLPNGLGWRLIYTGQTTASDGRGWPLYWIVEYQDKQTIARREELKQEVNSRNATIRASGFDFEFEPQPVKHTALCVKNFKDRPYVAATAFDACSKDRVESSPAVWRLKPVNVQDAPASMGEFSQPYVLINHSTSLMIGRADRGLTPETGDVVVDRLPLTPLPVADDDLQIWALRPQSSRM